MTDKQPEALRLSERISDILCASEEDAKAIAAAADELVRLHSEYESLRTGYAAARLEIESLQARIKTMAEEHADELMVAHLDGRSQAAQQPAPSAAVSLSDDLRDKLVAISEAVADQDDRAAQAMLREILAAPQPFPAQAGAVPLTDEQIEALPLWRRFVGLWPETRREIVQTIEHQHGIKGGQHDPD